jgi:hypothetical protein
MLSNSWEKKTVCVGAVHLVLRCLRRISHPLQFSGLSFVFFLHPWVALGLSVRPGFSAAPIFIKSKGKHDIETLSSLEKHKHGSLDRLVLFPSWSNKSKFQAATALYMNPLQRARGDFIYLF